MKKARVIITHECKRHCPYCCNKYKSIMALAKTVKLDEIREYEEVMITGGEPGLNLPHTLNTIQRLKIHNPGAKFFLYSAWFLSDIEKLTDIVGWVCILKEIDGIHYTLHEDYSDVDAKRLENLEEFMKNFPDKSFRLYVQPLIRDKVKFTPNLYKRVESKPWITEDILCLPKDEELFILEDA